MSKYESRIASLESEGRKFRQESIKVLEEVKADSKIELNEAMKAWSDAKDEEIRALNTAHGEAIAAVEVARQHELAAIEDTKLEALRALEEEYQSKIKVLNATGSSHNPSPNSRNLGSLN